MEVRLGRGDGRIRGLGGRIMKVRRQATCVLQDFLSISVQLEKVQCNFMGRGWI
jgi:hypothetical protein